MNLFSKAVKNHWEKTILAVNPGNKVSSRPHVLVGTRPSAGCTPSPWAKGSLEPREHGYMEHMTPSLNYTPSTQDLEFSDQMTPNSIPGPTWTSFPDVEDRIMDA